MTLETGGPITEQQRTFLDTILRNVRHVNALVSDLLDLSRIESGRIQTAPEPIDLTKSVDQAVIAAQRETRTQHKSKARLPSIAVNLTQDLPTVRADAGWLARVWIHLMRNALRYTPDDGQIVVRANLHDRNPKDPSTGQWVVCAIESSGAGFSAKEEENVFKPFYRMPPLQSAREPGTGLELAIARRVVELHGGRIWTESKPGEGSTILFTLPQA
jgi:signal transduction histidine kinase